MMTKNNKRQKCLPGVLLTIVLTIALLLGLSGCSSTSVDSSNEENQTPVQSDIVSVNDVVITEDGQYDSKDEVGLYIYTYGHLPDNYMTKSEARELGWSSGALDVVVPGYAIGGDTFGNYEGNLPAEDGVTYIECDIDTIGQSSRGAKRIVYSSDGHIYYTEDHYETFVELTFGDE